MLRIGDTGAFAGVAAAFVMICFQIAWGKASEELNLKREGDDTSEDSDEPAVKAGEKFQEIVSGKEGFS